MQLNGASRLTTNLVHNLQSADSVGVHIDAVIWTYKSNKKESWFPLSISFQITPFKHKPLSKVTHSPATHYIDIDNQHLL